MHFYERNLVTVNIFTIVRDILMNKSFKLSPPFKDNSPSFVMKDNDYGGIGESVRLGILAVRFSDVGQSPIHRNSIGR
jgi:hypothetical protein